MTPSRYPLLSARQTAGEGRIINATPGRSEVEEKLRESDARFSRLVERGDVLVYRYRPGSNPGYAYMSPSISVLTGHSVEACYADPRLLLESVDPADRASYEQMLRVPDSPPRTLRVRHENGEVRWIETRHFPVYDDAGKLVEIEGIARDITETKRAENELGGRLKRYAAVAEFGRSALAETDLSRLLNEAAKRVAETLEVELVEVLELRPEEELLVLRAGAGWPDGVAGRVTVPLDDGFRAGYALASEEPVVVHERPAERRFRDSQLPHEPGAVSGLSAGIRGGERPFGVLAAHTRSGRSFDEDDAHFLQDMANILSEAIVRYRKDEELRQSVESLRAAGDQRRKLLGQLVRAQEQERKRVASDIHDDSVQVLTALVLRTGLLRLRLQDPQMLEMVAEIETTVRLAIERLRRLLFELRPPELDRAGLGEVLSSYLRQTEIDTGLAFGVESHVATELRPDVKTTVYRIAQEAIVNVRKHAQATRVDVTLEDAPGGILVRIVDDGKGFALTEGARAYADDHQPGHLGLVSMRERAELGGGRFRIDSAPGRGTTVEFFVPGVGAEVEEAGTFVRES